MAKDMNREGDDTRKQTRRTQTEYRERLKQVILAVMPKGVEHKSFVRPDGSGDFPGPSPSPTSAFYVITAFDGDDERE